MDNFLVSFFNLLYTMAVILGVVLLYAAWYSINNQPSHQRPANDKRYIELIGIIYVSILSFSGLTLSHMNLSLGWSGVAQTKIWGAYWIGIWFFLALSAIAISIAFSRFHLPVSPIFLPIILSLLSIGLIVIDHWENRVDQRRILNHISIMVDYSKDYDKTLNILTPQQYQSLAGDCVSCANVFDSQWVKRYRDTVDGYNKSRLRNILAKEYPSFIDPVIPHSWFVEQGRYAIVGIFLLFIPVWLIWKWPRGRIFFEENHQWVGLGTAVIAGIGTAMAVLHDGQIPAIYVTSTQFYSVTDIIKFGLVIYLAGFLSTRYAAINKGIVIKHKKSVIDVLEFLISSIWSLRQPILIIGFVLVMMLLSRDWGGMSLMLGICTILAFIGAGPKFRSQLLLTCLRFYTQPK